MKRDLSTIKAVIKADYKRHVKRFSMITSTHDIVFIGDSLVAYFPHNMLDSALQVQWMGIPGDTSQGVLERLDHVIRLKPRKLVLHVGINDEMLIDFTPEMTIKTIGQIIDELEEALPDMVVIVVSLTPINHIDFPHGTYVIDRSPKFAVKVNEGLTKLKHIIYLDLYHALLDDHDALKRLWTTDGIHLSQSGYQIYAKLLKSVL